MNEIPPIPPELMKRRPVRGAGQLLESGSEPRKLEHPVTSIFNGLVRSGETKKTSNFSGGEVTSTPYTNDAGQEIVIKLTRDANKIVTKEQLLTFEGTGNDRRLIKTQTVVRDKTGKIVEVIES